MEIQPLGCSLVGVYWNDAGEYGFMGAVGGTVGIDLSVDIMFGEIYGDPSLLDGAFFSTSGSVGEIGGGVIYDSTGNNQIGKFYGPSLGPVPGAYHQTYGYGGHQKIGVNNKDKELYVSP